MGHLDLGIAWAWSGAKGELMEVVDKSSEDPAKFA